MPLVGILDMNLIMNEGQRRIGTRSTLDLDPVQPTEIVDRILVVDDDPSVLDFLSKLLSRQGYQVSESSGFQEAMANLEEEEFSLVLTDLSLPDGNGIELINRVHEHDPETVCVLITGYGTMESAIEAIHARVYDLLPKPFDAGQLISTVRNGLEKRRLETENRVLISKLRLERESLQERVDVATHDLQTKLREVERLNNEITVLFEIMKDIRGESRMSESLERLTRYLGQALDFDSVFWIVTDVSDQILTVKNWREGDDLKCALSELSPSLLEELRGFIDQAVDLTTKQRAIKDWLKGRLESNMEGEDFIIVPIRTSSDFFGLIGFSRDTPFLEEDRRIVSLAVSQLVTLWEENAVIQRGSQMASIGEMTAELAHDLRNGISALRHISDHFIGKVDLSDPQNAEYREVLTENLNRTDDLIKELLTFGRKDDDLSRTTPVRKLVDRVLRISGKILERNGVEVSVEIEDENLIVSGSTKEVSEALINVVMNSIQAMKAEGGKLTLGVRSRQSVAESMDHPRRFVRISVTDTGVGIPPEDLKRVFGRYFTTKSEGTGLGLPRLQKVAKKYLGFTEIESEVGKGTTVSLYLPQV